jgi:hypothetical protein
MADEQDLSKIHEDAIPAGTDVLEEARQFTVVAAEYARGEARDFDLQAAQENLEQSRQDRAERKKYASHIFKLVCAWLGAIVAMLLSQGFLGPWRLFHLSDSVLIATVTSTTASIVAIFAFVAKYLFPRR